VATPIFATVGVPFGVFLAAAILSVPKSFVPVYVGWTAKPENDGMFVSSISFSIPHIAFDRQHHGQNCVEGSFGCGNHHHTLHVRETLSLFSSVPHLFIFSLWWVNRKMKQAKEDYIYARRKARQGKPKGPVYISAPSNVTV
jgi:hypothetical protein